MTSVVVLKRSSTHSSASASKPAVPKRAFASENDVVTSVSALAGLSIIGRTGPLPNTIPPTSSRRAASSLLISEPVYSPIAASTITPKARSIVTPRKPAVTSTVSKPVVKKKVTAPAKKVDEAKSKKATKKEDSEDKVTSASNPAVPSEKKAAPAPVTSPTKVATSTPKPVESFSDKSVEPVSSRNAPFPEYSAQFARDNAHVIQTTNSLTAPYDILDDGLIYRPGCRPATKDNTCAGGICAIPPKAAAVAAAKPAVKKFELDKFGRLTIPLTDLMEAVEWVHAKGKTSLILDPSKRVDTFYSYNSTQLIEGKKLFLAKMHGAATLDAQLEALRKQVNIAWRYGHTLLLSLADSAVDFLKQYNAPTFFPTEKLFDAQPFLPVRAPMPPNAPDDWEAPEPVFNTPSFCNDLTRQADHEKGGWWFNMKEPLIHKDYRMVVTSEFELEDYQEFLRESIPLQQCIVVQIIQPEGAEYQSPMKQLKHLLL